MAFVQYCLVLFSSFLHIVIRTSLPLVLLLIIHGILVAMKLVLVQLFTDCSDLLSELIFHSGVGKSLQSGFKCFKYSKRKTIWQTIFYVWDSLSLVAGAIIVYCIAKKGRRSITPLRLFYLCVGCFMVILAVIAMLVGEVR